MSEEAVNPAPTPPAAPAPAPAPTPPNAPVPRFAVKVDSYVDNMGRHIQHRIPVVGTAPADFSPYSGFGESEIEIPGSEKRGPDGAPVKGTAQRQKFPERFDIKGATTLEEAFAMYDAAFGESAKQTQKEFYEYLIRKQKEVDAQMQAAAMAELARHRAGVATAQPGNPKGKPKKLIRP